MMLIRRELLGAAGASQNDPYFENVTLLLHGDGTNGGQNNTFIDSSTNNFTITRNGNTTQGSFSPYGDRWSNYFDGSGDYLTAPDNAALELGSSNFCIEGWFYPTDGTQRYLFAKGNGSLPGTAFDIRLDTARTITVIFYNGSTVIINFTTTGTVTNNLWNHVAIVRNGTTFTCYINGVSVGSASSASAVGDVASGITIGALPGVGNTFLGYVSNFRVVIGSAVYTSSFTPPTIPLTAITNTSLLTCQSNRFIDNSSNNFTITRNGDVSVQRFSPFSPSAAYSTATIGGSGYFDGGSTTSVSASSATAFDFGTGDFTIECFAYVTSQFNSFTILGSTSGVNQYWGFGTLGSGGMTMYAGTAGTDIYSGSGNTPALNQWNHLVWQRASGVASMYLNGTRVYNAAYTADFGSSATGFVIGKSGSYNNYYTIGYISNFRVVKGSAVYSGATITVPTQPLTNVTNTSLLLNFTNASIFDNAMMADLETVGNAQIDTAVKKFGTGSLEFDGNGDYLIAPSNPAFAFGTGDFTIEFWVYVSGTSAGQILFDQRTSASQIVPTVYIETNTIYYFVNGSSRISAGFTTTNSWVHVAVSRSGTSTKLFIGGTQAGSTYTDSNNYIQNPVYIGARWDANAPLSGYIDDLRITKGVARYTANFTPPTAAFPNK